MARAIPISWVVEPGEIIYLTELDDVDKPVNTPPMTCGCSAKGCAMGQHMVDQRPVFDNALRRRKRRRSHGNQVIGRTGIIRPDKRHKAKYV